MGDLPKDGWVVPDAHAQPTPPSRVSIRRWIAAALVGVAVWIAFSALLDLLSTGALRLPIVGFVLGTTVAWKIAGARGIRGVLIAAGAVFAADVVILGGLILIASLLRV